MRALYGKYDAQPQMIRTSAARPEWSSFCGAKRSKKAGTEDGKAAQKK